MTDSAELSQLKRALVALKEMRARLDALEKARTEPIAIIGLGCRFPGGADSPEKFWQMLLDGVDAIQEAPADRWSVEDYYHEDEFVPGKMNTRWGGFLEKIDQFDASFFGISPREARQMDPQQRLLLETAVEALEQAGLPLAQLTGSKTGVFVGAHSHSNEYAWLQFESLANIDAHSSTGTAHSILANRLSYLFDWHGPSLSVDTACSSSLVAAHLAVNSLRAGESDIALAAGVNLLLTPETSVTMSKLQALSPDGRCKTFDADANGFVRGEGCGVLVLKRLSDALADGDHVVATIVGTAVNQDGATNGLTAPSGLSQEQVIQQALANAKLNPATISYIEAHGTGTVLGDPIEVEALTSVLGQSGSQTCYLGSVKTNIGHLEGAAGVAGLIKTALALQHGELPPHLHFQALNPHISFDDTRFAIAHERTPWHTDGEPRRAGVSSFGFGGTNAHLILEQPPAQPETAPLDAEEYLLPLSARSEQALKEAADRLARYLQQTDTPLANVGYTAARRRHHHALRLVVHGRTGAEIADRLRAFARDEQMEEAVYGRVADNNQGVVFVFSGQGTKLLGMGQTLLKTEPIFRETIAQCDELLQTHANWSLLAELTAVPEQSNLHRNDIAQPAIFAVQVALAALWRSWGVHPDAVIGHSLGEIAAAHAAGAIDLAQAIRIVYHRGRVLAGAEGAGTMAATGLSQAQANDLLAHVENVSLAVVNGPQSTVLSGSRDELEKIVTSLQEQNTFARMLGAVNYPSHSALMTPFQEQLATALQDLEAQAPKIPLYAASRGWIHDASCTADFWAANIRQPVLFADGITTLAEEGYSAFIEISHHPMLNVPIQQTISELTDHEALVVGSLRHNQSETAAMLQNLAALHAHGIEIDWSHFYPQGRVVNLPTYPWCHQTYWLPETPRRTSDGRPADHPLLGNRLPSPLPTFELVISQETMPFLADHQIAGTAVMPAAAYVEMALAAATESLSTNSFAIRNLAIQEALAVPAGESHLAQLILIPEGDGARFQFASRADEEQWTTHAQGFLYSADSPLDAATDLVTIQERTKETAVTTFYERLAQNQLQFGPHFQAITRLWQGEGEALAKIERPSSVSESIDTGIALLDACLQPLIAAIPDGKLHLLIGLEQLAISALPDILWSHARLEQSDGDDPNSVRGALAFYDENGVVIGAADGVLLRQTTPSALRRLLGDGQHLRDWMYDVAWEPQPLPPSSTLPSPDQILATVNGRLPALKAENAPKAYIQLLPQLETLSHNYVRQAFAEMDWPFPPGAQFSLTEVAAALHILPKYRHLLAQFLNMLAAAGDLQSGENGWTVISPPAPTANPTNRMQTLKQEVPECQAELDLLARCGPALADVLRGEVDPLTLLFPNGDAQPLTAFYADSAFSRLPNAAIAAAVAAVAAAKRPLRILEIGAGTGGTTTAVLPTLPPDSSYVFSDVSPHLVEQARTKFGDHPSTRFTVLDIEQANSAQSVGGPFDLIIAANVLHATKNLGQTLHNVGQWLAPNGLLLALEVTQPQDWITITFGLTDGWWHFADNRQHQPLLAVDEWPNVLTQASFESSIRVSLPPELPTLFLAQRPTSASQHWLVFADEQGVGDEVVVLLQKRGDTAITIRAGEQFGGADNTFTLNPQHPEQFQRLLSQFDAPPHGLIYLWGLDTGDDTAKSLNMTTAALHLAQALTETGNGRLWLVTRQTQSLAGEAPAAAQAPLWGFGRVLALEHPEIWGGLLDLDTHDSAEHILSEITNSSDEDQIACRNGRRFVARLRREALPASSTPQWQAGAYLITGGLGGLGLKLATWLTEKTSAHLVLTSRSGLPERAGWNKLQSGSEMARRVAAVRELESRGASVTAVSLDVADADAMRDLFAQFGTTLPPLRGVFHLAATIDFSPLADMTSADMARMFHAKITGAMILHKLTSPISLDHFVLFSSTTALWGVSQMAHYAAANAFLDALAHTRHAQGLPGLSINWGTWAEMRLLSSTKQDDIAGFGLRPMPISLALDALERAMHTATVQKAIADVDWSRLKPAYEARRKRPFFAEITWSDAPINETAAKQSGPSLQEALAQADDHERQEVLRTFLRQQIATVMGFHDHEHLDEQQGLFDVGLDSLMAVELRNRLKKATGHDLPTTLIFNYPSVAALADYLANNIFMLQNGREGATTEAAASPAANDTIASELDNTEEGDLLAMFDNELGEIDDLLDDPPEF